jgi:hypothetical protein
MIQWRDKKVRVQAKLIPRYLWLAASIDVYLDDECILRSGGKLKIMGSYSAPFSCDGSAHRVDLGCGLARIRYFPYHLQIDGANVDDSRVYIQNWPVGYLVGLFIGLAIGSILFWIHP